MYHHSIIYKTVESACQPEVAVFIVKQKVPEVATFSNRGHILRYFQGNPSVQNCGMITRGSLSRQYIISKQAFLIHSRKLSFLHQNVHSSLGFVLGFVH